MKLYKDKKILRTDFIYFSIASIVFFLNNLMIDKMSDLQIRMLVHEFSRYTAFAILILIILKITYDFFLIHFNVFIVELKENSLIVNSVIRNSKHEIYYADIKEIKYYVKNNVGDIVIFLKDGAYRKRVIQISQIHYSLPLIKNNISKEIKLVRLT